MVSSRTTTVGLVSAALVGSTWAWAAPSTAVHSAVAPIVINPDNYVGFITPPEVDVSPISRSAHVTVGSLDRMAAAIFSDLGADPFLSSHDVKVGVWNGQECTNLQDEGRRSWTFADNASKAFLEARSWNAPPTALKLSLYRGAGSAYPAGARLCAVERVRWTTSGLNDSTVAVYGTTSQPGVASQVLPELPLTAGRTYSGVLPAPTVGPVAANGVMRVTNPSLASVGAGLANDGFGEALMQSRELRVGATGPDGTCDFQVRPPAEWTYVGPRGRKFEDSRNWGVGSWVDMRIGTNLRGTLVPGVTPCVVQRVTFRYADRNGTYTLLSRPGVAENTIPGPSIAEVDLTDIDPGSGDIVLDDFDLQDENGAALQPGTIPSLIANADVIRQSLDQVRDLATLLTRRIPGGAVNQPVGLEPRQFPDLGPDLDADAQAVVQQAQAVTTRAQASLAATDAATQQSPEYADLAQGVQQLQSAVTSVTATVPIAGGAVPVPYLGAAVRVNLASAPVTGLKGVAKLGATTLSVRAPASVKRGGQAVVTVMLTPRTAKGRVVVSVVRKVPTGIQVIATAKAPVRTGKAVARLTIPRAAPRASYSVVTSYLPPSGSVAGVSALRPVSVR